MFITSFGDIVQIYKYKLFNVNCSKLFDQLEYLRMEKARNG